MLASQTRAPARAVVAPEQLGVCYEARCAEEAEPLRLLGVGAQLRLDRVGLGARKCCPAVTPDSAHDICDHRGIVDLLRFCELRTTNFARKLFAPSLLQAHQRNARREQRILRKRIGQAELQSELGAQPLAIAHHVAALRRIEIERRGVPTLRFENRTEQERAPAHRHARRFRERRDAHRGDV
jgi:hypothetical protein